VKELEPFWRFSGEEFRRRVEQVGQLPSIDVVRLRNGSTVTLNVTKKFHDSEDHARAKGFRVMIEKFQKKLPDMDFPINAKAESRVLVPWEHQKYPELAPNATAGLEGMLGGEFAPDWRGDGSVWESFRRTCDPSSQARRLFGSVRGASAMGPVFAHRPQVYLPAPEREMNNNQGDFTFVKDVDYDFDFCADPWARYNQGHFFSDWRTIPVLYPVFSPASARGFSDIVIPSHYYYSSTKKYTYGWDPEKKIINDVDYSEVAWENKTDKIFWRGATTGGGNSPPGFMKTYQRHRLLEMTASTMNDTTKEVTFPHPKTGEFITAEVPIKELNEDFMDMAFTKAVGCTPFPGGCKALQSYYRFSEPVPMGDLWKYKYLIDVDGMGYSARSMSLLISESAMIKSTVYREFFTDWIQPWLHFIPLSQSYKEIYNIHAFFSGASPAMLKAAGINSTALSTHSSKRTPEAEGPRLLRKIAEDSRDWKRAIARKVDMEAYVYRLCLEYARLWSDDREAMSYSV